MFKTLEWSDSEQDEKAWKAASSGTSGGSSSTMKKKKRKKKSRKQKDCSDGLAKSLLSQVHERVDRQVNSPGFTEQLVAVDRQRKGRSVGSILRMGIKFASEVEFKDFVRGKKKQSRGGKHRRLSNGAGTSSDGDTPPVPPPKRKKHSADLSNMPKFDVEKLKSVLSRDKEKSQQEAKRKKEEVEVARGGGGKVADAKTKLKSSRFRYLNQLLYTQDGRKSFKMFKNDPEAFETYHEGFSEQVRKWPINPLDSIIGAIMKRSDSPVVVDFGCGEARLARTLESSCEKIHSFDLVALNDRVTVCDFANTPLEDESVDVGVFCLSLMGSNLRDYLAEANRVLKINATLKIAEVESRFSDDVTVDHFIKLVEKLGFKLKWKNLKHEFFYFMDFKKVSQCKKKGPDFSLRPCLYKKR